MAYYRVEPFGHRIDHQMAAQQAVISVAVGGVKDAQLADYMPQVKPRETSDNELSWEDAFPTAAVLAKQLESGS